MIKKSIKACIGRLYKVDPLYRSFTGRSTLYYTGWINIILAVYRVGRYSIALIDCVQGESSIFAVYRVNQYYIINIISCIQGGSSIILVVYRVDPCNLTIYALIITRLVEVSYVLIGPTTIYGVTISRA